MEISGGYLVHENITTEDMNIFHTAMNEIEGVDYNPLAVATQVVNGINYCFICKSKVVAPNSQERISKVIIYKPLTGKLVISNIEVII